MMRLSAGHSIGSKRKCKGKKYDWEMILDMGCGNAYNFSQVTK